MEDAVNSVREMRAPRYFLPELLSKIILCSLEWSDEDKEHVSALIYALRTEGLVTGENFMQVNHIFHILIINSEQQSFS